MCKMESMDARMDAAPGLPGRALILVQFRPKRHLTPRLPKRSPIPLNHTTSRNDSPTQFPLKSLQVTSPQSNLFLLRNSKLNCTHDVLLSLRSIFTNTKFYCLPLKFLGRATKALATCLIPDNATCLIPHLQ